jgi:DNA-binding NarL/FixJ family response regulator
MESAAKNPIRIAVVENDPLRFVGFRALFDGDRDFILQSRTPSTIFEADGYDVVLISARIGPAMYEIIGGLKALNPTVCIIATGNVPGDEFALRALSAGAKGYVEESARPEDFREAIRTVSGGSVWAEPRLFSKLIERMTNIHRPAQSSEPLVYTEREREVLNLLVSGRSNKEIGGALGIEERTVKMHVAKLMRKAGVNNRIALSVHALTHSLLGVNQSE